VGNEVVRPRTWLCVPLSCLLAGCAVGPNYKRPLVSAPSTFQGEAASEPESLADLAWWDLFSDRSLGVLIKEALANNNDLRNAIARVEEARDLVGAARAAYYPRVDDDLGVQRDRGVFKSVPQLELPTSERTQNLFLAGLSTVWEADVWGRIRRSNEAVRAEFIATEQGRRGLMLSLVSAVAQAYFELQELDGRLSIARNSTGAFESTHALFNRRYAAGITSRLAVARAESALAEASSTVADIERQIAIKEHQICVLLGRNPGAIPRDPPNADAQVPPTIPAGLPSSLLDRRPDLLEAEQLLVAASARIGIARADFLPRIGLTTLVGAVSPELSTLTDGSATIWTLAARSTGPIFTGGQLKGHYRAAVAAFDQAKWQYLQETLKAFQEVSDALVSAQKLTKEEDQQKRQVSALSTAVAIADRRYRGGLASYYEVLEAQQLLFPAQIALSQTRRDRLLAVIQIYKALGGGWKLTDSQWTRGQP
jgi:outer membrane protein, multidrug efflux system